MVRLPLSPTETFPALRGVQAGREYYVSVCRLKTVREMFVFDDKALAPELRAQRMLNRSRVPEMARYLLENRDSYVFSALTASIDGDVTFVPFGREAVGEGHHLGVLLVPKDATILINDGQHRRAAIELAVDENPEIGEESIAVVFFIDIGLKRSQQMFADLNRYAIRPSRSISVLYDHRDETAELVRQVVAKSGIFRDVVEMEKSSLGPRSRKLFTLSALHTATCVLLQDIDKPFHERVDLAVEFWAAVATHFPDWQRVREGKRTSGEVRREYIHSHGVVLQALGRAGNTLLREHPEGWKSRLKPLAKINWRRSNGTLWEGRALIGGSVKKSGKNVTLTTNVIKRRLRLKLTDDERRIERAHKKGAHGR